jgi:hypothetical protein
MIKLDINKFSFAQMTSNSDGKTSGSGTMGILICAVGSICFLLGCLDVMFFSKTIDILTQSIIITGIGASLLGYRKSQEKLLQETPEEPAKETPLNS